MFEIKYIFTLAVLCIFDLSSSLVTLPEVEDNNIVETESVIRSTVNSIFATLGLKKVRNKSLLKQYSAVHNYFVSLTLQDYNCLKEIEKLAKVGNTFENVTTNYEFFLNEILDEDNILKRQTIAMGEDDNTEIDISSEIDKLLYLKKQHDAEYNKRQMTLNEEVLKILQRNEKLNLNVTTTEKLVHRIEDKILEDLPTWHDEDMVISGRRIYNGKRTKFKRFPFIASVQIFNKFQCGGSIIQNDLVLTAASCLQLAWNNRLYRENPAFLSVRVGTSYYEFGGEQIGVLEVYFHPNYVPKNLRNNLAVLRLVRKMKLPNKMLKKTIKKVDLDKEESGLPLTGQKVRLVGWGARLPTNKEYNPYEDRLRCATLSIYPLVDCQDVYSKEYVTNTNFCAGSVTVGSGACTRDVGDPGLVWGKLTGVVSFGAPLCGTPDAPTVFTKVGFYYDWIESIMEQDVPSRYQMTTPRPGKVKYETKELHLHWTVKPVKQKDLLNVDKNTNQMLFKHFLKTMFNSDEIDEYISTITDMPTNSSTNLNETEEHPIKQEPEENPLYLYDLKNQNPLESKAEVATLTPKIGNNTNQGLVTVHDMNWYRESESDSDEDENLNNTKNTDSNNLYNIISVNANRTDTPNGESNSSNKNAIFGSEREDADEKLQLNDMASDTNIADTAIINLHNKLTTEAFDINFLNFEQNHSKTTVTIDNDFKEPNPAKNQPGKNPPISQPGMKSKKDDIFTLLYVSDSERHVPEEDHDDESRKKYPDLTSQLMQEIDDNSDLEYLANMLKDLINESLNSSEPLLTST